MICAVEFIMADDAFALSPISARATQPREEDYEAISDAFMETSRGRWFLSEYAKRNRNADTRMVLDAVARIEENLAAQQEPASDGVLADALVAIRNAVDEARATASAALDSSALEEALAPIRKGARIIREISWRWREIGADGRICDLLDSQVGAIEAGCGQLASTGPALALSAAFDLINERIAEFDDGDRVSPRAAEEAVAFPDPNDEAPAFTSEADDEDAVLDRIAFEMAADDPSDIDDLSGIGETYIDETHIAEPQFAAPEMIAEVPEPTPAPAPPPTMIEPSHQPSHQPSNQSSLGSALIANGIVRRPHAPASDPLAPIRRMTQAEKIAFFS
jgi:hypothetical protein